MRLPLTAFFCVALCPVGAFAEPAPARPPRREPRRVATLSIDLPKIVAPAFQVSSEVSFAPRFSLAMGAGVIGNQDRAVFSPPTRVVGWDAVVEPRWYAHGDFSGVGLHLGWLTSFARFLEPPLGASGVLPPPGLATGPTIGLKASGVPLLGVIDVEAGPLLLAVRADAARGFSSLAPYWSFGIGRSF